MPQGKPRRSNGIQATDPASQLESRRSDSRIMTVYRHVKIEHNGDEGLARCRNISAGGMKLRTSIPVNLNDEVIVTFWKTQLKGRVVWHSGHDCGVAFDEPVDCGQLLHTAALETLSGVSHSHQINSRLPATIAYEGKTCPTTVADVSVRDMKIVHDGDFQPGLHVRVILNNGCEKEGVVRWSRDNIAGVILLDPFDIDDLGSARQLAGPAEP